jgi:hypothetical protein
MERSVTPFQLQYCYQRGLILPLIIVFYNISIVDYVYEHFSL